MAESKSCKRIRSLYPRFAIPHKTPPNSTPWAETKSGHPKRNWTSGTRRNIQFSLQLHRSKQEVKPVERPPSPLPRWWNQNAQREEKSTVEDGNWIHGKKRGKLINWRLGVLGFEISTVEKFSKDRLLFFNFNFFFSSSSFNFCTRRRLCFLNFRSRRCSSQSCVGSRWVDENALQMYLFLESIYVTTPGEPRW